MTKLSKFMAATVAVAGLAALSAPAHAQSTEEVLGVVIGGSLGAVIGGEIDNRGSSQEGEIIGAIVGGTIGYAIGDNIDDRNDRRDRYVYDDRYQRAYANDRYRDRYRHNDRYGYSQPVYKGGYPTYRSGKKDHPVHAFHPGKGRGKGLYKRR